MQAPFFSLLLLRMGVGAFFFSTGIEKTEWLLLAIGVLLFFGLFVQAASIAGALTIIAARFAPGTAVTALADVLPSLPLAILMILILAVLFFGRTGEFMGIDGFLKTRKFQKPSS